MKIRLLLGFLIILLTNVAFSQFKVDSISYQIQTKDGNVYVGKLVGQESDKILLETQNLGIIQLFKADIKKMEAIETTLKNGKLWVQHVQSTKYFNLPTSYNLKQGEIYYQNSWVFFNHLGIGLTDNISIGAGVIPIFLFGSESIPVWFTAKGSIPIVENKLAVGINGVLAAATGESEGAGFLYGTGTLGNRDKNITMGLGYGYADQSWSDVPLITLSASVRTSAKAYFITENYYVDGTAWISLGGRRIFNPISLDFGLFIPAGISDSLIGIPWLSVIIPLRSKKS